MISSGCGVAGRSSEAPVSPLGATQVEEWRKVLCLEAGRRELQLEVRRKLAEGRKWTESPDGLLRVDQK
jgi:hypothetical protein